MMTYSKILRIPAWLQCCALLILSGSAQAQWTKSSGVNGGQVSSFSSNNSYIFVGTDTSGVYRSNNQGDTWEQVNTGLGDKGIAAVQGRDNLVVAALKNGFGGVVYVSTDNGVNWAPPTNQYYGFAFCFALKGSDILMGTWYGLARSTNNGGSWPTMSTTGLPSNASVTAIAVNSSGAIFAGVSGSSTGGEGVFISTDNGANWSPRNTGLTNPLVHSFAITPGYIFAGTTNGIFRSADNGNNWTSASAGLGTGKVTSIISRGSYLFAATASGVFVSSNNGTSWSDASGNIPSGSPITAMAIFNDKLFIGAGAAVWTRSASDIATSVMEAPVSRKIAPWPNPCNDILNIGMDGCSDATGVVVTDLTGRHLLETPANWKSQNLTLDVSDLPHGMYFLNVMKGESVLASSKISVE